MTLQGLLTELQNNLQVMLQTEFGQIQNTLTKLKHRFKRLNIEPSEVKEKKNDSEIQSAEHAQKQK